MAKEPRRVYRANRRNDARSKRKALWLVDGIGVSWQEMWEEWVKPATYKASGGSRSKRYNTAGKR
jgi:hypothetical protein